MSQEEQLKIMRLDILGNTEDDNNDEVFVNMLNNAKVVALNTLYPYNQEIRKALSDPYKDLRGYRQRGKSSRPVPH